MSAKFWSFRLRMANLGKLLGNHQYPTIQLQLPIISLLALCGQIIDASA